MEIMKILSAVAEVGINGGIGKAQEIRLMAGKTEIIGAISIGGIKRFRITAGQQAKILRSMGLVTGGTAALCQRAMKMFFPLDFGFNIFQRFCLAAIVLTMATQAEIHFLLQQQS